MRTPTAIGRVAALLALVVAVVAVVMLFSGGGEKYEVTGEFENASQLVGGEVVVVGGKPVGSVSKIDLGDQGQAMVTFSVNEDYAPLSRGTTATIRSYSLSGIANRQVQLTLPEDRGEEIPKGGVLSQQETVSEVDLDELFNTLDPDTVEDFKHVIQGFDIAYDGVGKQANKGYKYFNPLLSTSRRLFAELNRDEAALESLIVDGAQLSGALAAKAPDISLLVHNANLMFGAIGREHDALQSAVAQLPRFMRQANTTFVNLRAFLDDFDPLVDASKPVAVKLKPFFREFRAAARDAVPTVKRLDAIIKKPGPDNDLIELTELQVPLGALAAGTGGTTLDCTPPNPENDDFTGDGAFDESNCALRNGLEALSFFRAYTPELVGWFNDFGTSGITDANGGIGRISTTFNSFTISANGLPELLGLINPNTIFDPLSAGGIHLVYQNRRCPGANERDPGDGSTPFTDGGTLNCNPSQTPQGP